MGRPHYRFKRCSRSWQYRPAVLGTLLQRIRALFASRKEQA